MPFWWGEDLTRGGRHMMNVWQVAAPMPLCPGCTAGPPRLVSPTFIPDTRRKQRRMSVPRIDPDVPDSDVPPDTCQHLTAGETHPPPLAGRCSDTPRPSIRQHTPLVWRKRPYNCECTGDLSCPSR